MRTLIVATGILLAGVTLQPISQAQVPAQTQTSGAALVKNPRVETGAGLVEGVIDTATIMYLGVPFAEPPVGELRWQPPKPHGPWQGVRDASRFGDHCFDAGRDAKQSHASEDCLFLNVYVPRRATTPRPVMVWIYGGSNGSGAGEYYDPTPLVETGEGVVAVTLNYRLGPFGFLAHPALDAEGRPAVNYGVMDQQLALKWVRENIGRFGGDARNVTIFGESAGGLNVTTHLVSPLSAGLFDRAIIQSGAYQLDTPSLKDSEALGVGFAQRAGCTDQTAACLRGLSVAVILANAGRSFTPAASFNHSTVDGRILVESQRAALAAGRMNRVPVLLGNNSDEGRNMKPHEMTLEQHKQIFEAILPAMGKDTQRALSVYSAPRYANVFDASSAAMGDRTFACGALQSAQLLSKWVPTYQYELADPASSALGATHMAELKYLFNVRFGPELIEASGKWRDLWSAGEGRSDLMPAPRQRLSQAMRTSWANFAQSGNPKSALLPHWPQASQGIQLLNVLSTVEAPQKFAARHQCAFWD